MPPRRCQPSPSHPLGVGIGVYGGSPLGRPFLESHGDAGTRATGTYWLILGGFAVVCLFGTWTVIVGNTRNSSR